MFRCFAWVLLCCVWWGGAKLSHARDVRLALLVANETGWGKEARLKGAITGDLAPLATALRKRLGFQVVTVSNGTPDDLRKAFHQINQRFLRAPRVTTFLFYYSGHADKKRFHLRKQAGVEDVTYREFLTFFLKLRVKRRVALLDACDSSVVIPTAAWHTSGRKTKLAVKGSTSPQLRSIQSILLEKERFAAKGPGYRRRKVDLQTIPMMTEQQTSGLHIIASNGNAFHNNKLGASVFTYHFLQGLNGQADNNRDGKITLDELYDYAQVKARKESGQEMDRLVFFRGSYTFAPHYRSRMIVAPNITGQLFVSVGEFTFQYTKSKKIALQLPMMNGMGTLHIRQGPKCWLQKVFLPTGGKTKVSQRGTATACNTLSKAYAQKGEESILLQANARPTSYKEKKVHGLALSVGVAELGAPPLRSRGLHLGVMYRWNSIIGVGLEYELGQPPVSYSLHRLMGVLEVGYPFRFRVPLEFFLGAYGRAGVTLGVTQDNSLLNALSLGVGAQLSLSYFVTQRWGIQLTGRAGLHYTPLSSGASLSFQWMGRMSGIFRF
ncbi:MAG: hypothetical protein EP343_27965 [Deltaproteobacteria bacterium]|nr:MAG: hypothetical protein EP343_27965 [Deltaproteobacteria bacterium]